MRMLGEYNPRQTKGWMKEWVDKHMNGQCKTYITSTSAGNKDTAVQYLSHPLAKGGLLHHKDPQGQPTSSNLCQNHLQLVTFLNSARFCTNRFSLYKRLLA